MTQLGSIRIGPPPPKRRGYSIRAKVVALLAAPLVPLLTMSVFAVSIALGPAQNLSDAKTTVDAAGVPTAYVLVFLEAERAKSMQYVSTKVHKAGDTQALADAQRATDERIADLNKLTSAKPFQDAASKRTASALAKLNHALATMADGRKKVSDGESHAAVMTFYNGIADNMVLLYRSIASVDDHSLTTSAFSVVDMVAAGEMLSREDALILGVVAAGTMTSRDYTDIVGTIAKQRQMYTDVASGLTGSDLDGFKQVMDGDAAKRLRSAEDSLIANPRIGAKPKIDFNRFQTDFNTVYNGAQLLNGGLAQRVIKATANAASSRRRQLVGVIVACTIMLLALIAFSWLNARNLLRRVARLRGEALTLAMDRLPSVVERVRAGQTVDVETEAPPLSAGTDELSQLSEAFTRVQRTAIASAVHEANLRQGFNQVFLNIARRSQTLLHRQLALLDAMERRATDPEELENLFRIDHLATRMRRHSEDLVILAGSTPGRGWRNPVPIADVLRAAASEVEEYARITVAVPPNLALVGRAVNDVVHLLAELLENATMFSPPGSPVTLTAHVVPNGLAVEVEDRGLGMSPEAIEEANARLAVPPDFDPAHSSRLGLFVVAKLAARQNIQVALRRSAYGGLAAVTLLPNDIVVPPSGTHPDAIDGVVVGDGALDTRPAAASRVMALTGATPTVVNSAPAGSAPDGDGEQPGDSGNRTPDGLPIRIRQASVARALPDKTDETIRSAPAAPARTPEQMRTMLTSFQSGMNQGRAVAASDAGPESGETGPAGHDEGGTGQTGAGQHGGGKHGGGKHGGGSRSNGASASGPAGTTGAGRMNGTEHTSAAEDGGPTTARGGGNDGN